MIRTKKLGAAAIGLFVFTASSSVAAPIYTFAVVVKTNDVVGGKTLTAFYPPSLNSNGTVAFVADYSGGKGVFTQSTALAKTGDTIGGQTITDLGLYNSFNDSGLTSFLAPYAGGSGIFTPNGVVAKTGDTIGGKSITSPYLTPKAMNNGGAVAFYNEYTGGKGVFTQTNVLAKTGDTIGGRTLTDLDSFISMNNAGIAAFEAAFSGGSGIFTQNGVLAKTGDVIGGETLADFGINVYGPALNDTGTAALFAQYGLAGSGIFTQDGAVVKVGDTIGGQILTGVYGQAINNAGVVAYVGFYQTGHGIFTQDGAVVMTGDTVGGKTISSLSSAFGPVINSHGDVAFLANFSDATSGIVVATLTNPVTPCTTLPLSSAGVGSSGGPGSFVVNANGGCTWTPYTHVDWITVLSQGPFTGSGSTNYVIAPNNSAFPRSGTIALSFGQPFAPDQVFTITQPGNLCAFIVGSPGGPAPSAGGTGSISVTAGAGCPWTAVSNNPWITVTGGSSGQGDGSVAYSVAANTGAARTGSLTIAGQQVTITQQAQPAVNSLSPVSGGGVTRTFTFSYSDPDGWQDLRILNVLINRALDGRNACYVAYDRPSNTLFLVGDIGGGLSPLVLNGSGSVGNSQCTINGGGSSAVGSGNTLTLTLSITFNQTNFGGEKVTYLAARDASLNNSGWRIMGIWSVPRAAVTYPTINEMTPSEGTGSTRQFTTTYRDATSSANLRTMQLLMNTDLNGNAACYLGYDHASNMVYLVNDINSGLLLPGIAPNSGTGSVENSQCRITGAGTTKSESGTDLALTVNITFKAGFSGPKVAYGGVQTISNANSDWRALGYWNVP